MKTIRFLAAGLLLLTGILHLYLAIKAPSDPNFVPALAFGIVYFAIGVFLILKKRFAIWLGFIIPIIPLVLSPFMVDFKNLDAWTIILLAIDLAVLICCLILLLKKNKITTTT